MRDTFPELLPPEALGLPQTTYDVLLKLADDLQAGTFAHATVAYVDDIDPREHAGKGLKLFNMSIWHHEIDDCGSVCCIAGWAEVYLCGRQVICRAGPSARDDGHDHVLDSPLFDNVTPEAADALHKLCYPDEDPEHPESDNYDYITPQMAARCIRDYLTTGEVDWEAVYAMCREFSSVNDAQAPSAKN